MEEKGRERERKAVVEMRKENWKSHSLYIGETIQTNGEEEIIDNGSEEERGGANEKYSNGKRREKYHLASAPLFQILLKLGHSEHCKIH